MLSQYDRFQTAFLVFSLVALATTTYGGVSLGVICDEGTIRGAINVVVDPWDTSFPKENWIGLVIQRGMVGACGSTVLLNTEPFPFPESQVPYAEANYSFEEPVPWPNRYFLYTAKAIDSEGNLYSVPGQGDPLPYAHVSCGEAVVARGFIVIHDWIYYEAQLEPCPGTCWNWHLISLGYLDPSEIFPLLGVLVNIYGEFYDDGMPTFGDIIIDRIEPTPDGECGPSPNAIRSWGALKQLYR
jgi:hypothetical protein